MRKIVLTTAILATSLVSINAFAGDIAAGKAKSATCAACHGADGHSPSPTWPNLAGQKEAYLVKQLKAFKDGSRKDPTMSPMAAPLSDADMDNLAAYYSSLK
ncbi:MAG TPA: cytochrome c [Oceanospirillales bacterium]|nr:cytochrome c [Oceanospirillales bacterium]